MDRHNFRGSKSKLCNLKTQIYILFLNFSNLGSTSIPSTQITSTFNKGTKLTNITHYILLATTSATLVFKFKNYSFSFFVYSYYTKRNFSNFGSISISNTPIISTFKKGRKLNHIIPYILLAATSAMLLFKLKNYWCISFVSSYYTKGNLVFFKSTYSNQVLFILRTNSNLIDRCYILLTLIIKAVSSIWVKHLALTNSKKGNYYNNHSVDENVNCSPFYKRNYGQLPQKVQLKFELNLTLHVYLLNPKFIFCNELCFSNYTDAYYCRYYCYFYFLNYYAGIITIQFSTASHTFLANSQSDRGVISLNKSTCNFKINWPGRETTYTTVHFHKLLSFDYSTRHIKNTTKKGNRLNGLKYHLRIKLYITNFLEDNNSFKVHSSIYYKTSLLYLVFLQTLFFSQFHSKKLLLLETVGYCLVAILTQVVLSNFKNPINWLNYALLENHNIITILSVIGSFIWIIGDLIPKVKAMQVKKLSDNPKNQPKGILIFYLIYYLNRIKTTRQVNFKNSTPLITYRPSRQSAFRPSRQSLFKQLRQHSVLNFSKQHKENYIHQMYSWFIQKTKLCTTMGKLSFLATWRLFLCIKHFTFVGINLTTLINIIYSNFDNVRYISCSAQPQIYKIVEVIVIFNPSGKAFQHLQSTSNHYKINKQVVSEKHKASKSPFVYKFYSAVGCSAFCINVSLLIHSSHVDFVNGTSGNVKPIEQKVRLNVAKVKVVLLKPGVGDTNIFSDL